MNTPFAIKASAASVLLAFAAAGPYAYGQTTPTTPDTSNRTTKAEHPAPAPTTASKPWANGSGLARRDVKFIEKVAMDGLAEVELGNLAQKQAQSAEVKDFGARMAKDHAKANDELKTLAGAKNLQLPSAPDKSHQKDFDKLAKKSGADFDRAYMDHMVKDHKKDVKAFEKEAKSAKDGDLRNFASNALPTLEEHLRLAQQTHDTVKGKK